MDACFITLILWCIIAGVQCAVPVVETQFGYVSGSLKTSRDGRPIYAFFGIPYAAPPIGELRLKPPVEPEPWPDTLDGSEKRSMCVQLGIDGSIVGDEDCLFLNVFTPDISKTGSERKFPVLVNIHGGGFWMGEGATNGPEYILDKDIVYVSFNYRLGGLGFLSTNTSTIPGNLGLKDQTFAFKWIHNNIAAFNGDPNDVTLVGHSAGGVSAHLHQFSPLSKDLFHKIIIHSGSAFCMWGYYEENTGKIIGNAFTVAVGCYSEDEYQVLKCLQRLPADVFVRKLVSLLFWDQHPVGFFKPVVEGNFKGAFLPSIPSESTYEVEDIPVLGGVAKDESAFLAASFLGNDGKLIKEMNERYEEIFATVMQYFQAYEREDYDRLGEQIRRKYFGDKEIDYNTRKELIDMINDSMFIYPLIETVLSTRGTRYFYLFDHRPNSYSFQNSFGGNFPEYLGVSHGEELPLILKDSYIPDLTAEDTKVSNKLVNYWTNFIIHGDPNGPDNDPQVWQPVSTDAVEYLHIGTDSDTMEKNLRAEALQFWDWLPLGRNRHGNVNILYTNDGLIKGTVLTSRGGKKFRAFYGIPYALPPVGELRYKAPIAPKPWKGIRDGTQLPPRCAQSSNYCAKNTSVVGSEDCLYLNVFTANTVNRIRKFPVLIFIHGGGFQMGYSVTLGPEFFMDKDMVLVTIDYRVGILGKGAQFPFIFYFTGFLGMDNEAITGNYGFKDQVLAMKWVKENIEAFGGDPDSITIAGQSAGGMSVHLHMFSPLSKGLFHKAIIQSGSIFSTWSYYEKRYTKAIGNAFAVLSGCYYEDANQVLECLQELPVEELIQKENDFYVWNCNPAAVYRASIEPNTPEAFLSEAPRKSTYVTKDIPVIIGVTSQESAAVAANYLRSDAVKAKEVDANYKRLLPLLAQYLYTAKREDLDEISEKIKEFYFQNRSIGVETDEKLAEFLSDYLFNFATRKAVSDSEKSWYLYEFDYRASYRGVTGNYPKHLGIPHSDELPLLFKLFGTDWKLTATDKEVSKRLVDYWSSFVIYGDPNGVEGENVWHPVSSKNAEYLYIHDTGDVMKNNFHEESYQFWNSLPLGRDFD